MALSGVCVVVDRGWATRGIADLLPAKRAMLAKNPIVRHRRAALRKFQHE